MRLAELDSDYLAAICEELQLSPKETAHLFQLWARRKIKKLRKAIIRLSRECTRCCYVSRDGLVLRELAEEGALL